MSASARARVRVVDLLRLLAAFQMVQGHTIDAVLAEDARSGPVFAAWVWARGLTSVAFLLVTGLAFHLATVADLPRHLADPRAIARRLRRGALLIGLGYALHAPLGPSSGGLGGALHGALIVDVLQNMGVSLWLLEGTLLALRSARAARALWLVLAAGLLVGAPFAAGLSPDGPLRPLLNFITPLGGSLFPLLPWTAHVLLGAALAPWLLAPDAPDARTRGTRFALAAAGLWALSWLVGEAGLALPAMHLQRLAAVLGVGAGLVALEPLLARAPAWIWRLSGETLVIYVLHILLAYASGASLRVWIGHVLPPLAAAGMALSMLLLCAAAALAYPRLLRGLARPVEAG